MQKALVTGAAGFIGARCAAGLMARGWQVTGLDALTDYYDVTLKQARLDRLAAQAAELAGGPGQGEGPGSAEATGQGGFRFVHERVESPGALAALFAEERYDLVIHLAAQAGVRYSIDNPRAYLESNIAGTFELLEAARAHPPGHMMLASTSSAYGAETEMPYVETMRADHQMSFYAATKKANENMAHSYAHLFGLPVTMFRFFTVYGPWGRPDMALFKFTRAILEDAPIDVYNHGDMKRDFTYIDDLVAGILALAGAVPPAPGEGDPVDGDSLSPVAPFRVVNIGNGAPVQLTDFIAAIEAATGRTARRNLMPMQPGDVPATWADTTLLERLTGGAPQTPIAEGVARFVAWYRDYYGV